jgi:GxxExxY protein
MTELLHKELSYEVVGAAMEVHRVLGPGFLEGVYQQELACELALRKIPFEQQAPLPVEYKGQRIGDYRADFVIAGEGVVEIKAVGALAPGHEAQTIHYLAATELRLALLLNFGTQSLQVKRVIRW